ncbi:MAG: glycoside hydrolase family 3 C-terminal domain-containing protein [Clostridia bacterium]|nr:glycoside hydrolase family 3 C-terminal domain-containing protein [Clostridia bacterium]
MHNYDDIISALTLPQKIRILTRAGGLSGKDIKSLGIRSIDVGDMKDYGRDVFPNATALINSWNEDIWSEVARAKTEMIDSEGKNFVIAPGPKVKLSPYRREISEDPCLASRFSLVHQAAATELGKAVAPSGFYLTRSDVQWLDRTPDDKIIHEFITLPYADTMPASQSGAIITDLRDIGRAYKKIPRVIEDRISEYAEFLVCKKATEENTVDFISRGIICLEGSEIALESAVARYKKLFASIENNEGATKEQLDEEVMRSSAISEESLDLAIGKLLAFIDKVNSDIEKKERSSADHSKIALRATLESAVLLKNKDRLLPLDPAGKVGIIGDIAFCEIDGERVIDRLTSELSARGYKVVGAARGYDMQTSYSDSGVREALDLVGKCDTVILLLGFGYEAEKLIPKTETLSLPANQISLSQKVLKQCKSYFNKNTVAIISAGHAPDIAFTREFDSVMLMPLEVKSSAQAAAMLLSGEESPSGKLAYTLYSDSDAAFAKARYYREKHSLKAGPFIGYRYYDTAELTVGYPFGHGLSYSRFRYSALSVSDGKVTFSVENLSEKSAAEVVQIYAGLEKPNFINPKKELCAFKKVELLAGEKRSFTVPFTLPRKYVNGEFVIPGGSYCVCIGSSVSDVRLKTFINHNGPAVPCDGERPCDYLQSVSNVREDNYTLEANYSVMKKSIRNILFGILFLALAISAAVFNNITKHPSTFVGVLAGILATVALVFIISEAVVRSRIYAADRKRINEANKELFEEAEEIPVLSTDKMFRDEFEARDVELESAAEAVEDASDSIFSEYVDSEFIYNTAVSEFKDFVSSRGLKLADGVAENVMSSIATSGLIITSGMDSESFASFVRVVCEYFGSETFVDKVERGANGNNLFFAFDYNGDFIKKNILLSLEYARENSSKLTVAALDGANTGALKEYLTPFTKYLYSPKSTNKISVGEDIGTEMVYNVPSNLRLFVNLSDKTSIDILPAHISTLASLIDVSFEMCAPDESFTALHELNRYQLEFMREIECAKADISEDVWKKVDKIEKYAKRFSDYRIGNKLWLAFEKHIAMLLSSGMVISEALDVAVAARLIPSISVALKGVVPEDEQSLAEILEFVFGEGNADRSRRIIDKAIFDAVECDGPIEEAETEEISAEEAVEEAVEKVNEESAEELTDEALEEEISQTAENEDDKEADAQEVEAEEVTEEINAEEVDAEEADTEEIDTKETNSEE